jgi:hypothetical protein
MSADTTRPVIAKAPVTAPASGTATVAVALKLPQGLILRYHEKQHAVEATPQGHRSYDIYVPIGEPFTLRGNATTAELERQGLIPDQGGYAITPGCPKDLWDQWSTTNRDSPLVVNGLIEAFPSEPEAQHWARTMGALRFGLERIDPDRPELTTGRRAHVNVTPIQPGQRG